MPSNHEVTGKAFLSAIIESFPYNYRYMLDYENYQTKTWLNRRWRIMLQPQQRTRYGSEIQMPLVSINSIPEVDIADINPFFYQYGQADEDELGQEARNE